MYFQTNGQLQIPPFHVPEEEEVCSLPIIEECEDLKTGDSTSRETSVTCSAPSSPSHFPPTGEEETLPKEIEHKYRLICTLAVTLQGAIFKVSSLQSGEDDFALKCTSKANRIQLNSAGSLSCYEDAQKEFRILKLLQGGDPVMNLAQNNIIPAWEFLETRDSCCIVMQLAKCDLFDIVHANGPLGESEAQAVMLQLLNALKFLKSCGVCHLDVSLENVLVDSMGNCYLSDFGVAEVIQDRNHTLGPHFNPGKPKYMAPEVVRSEEFCGFAADMYSLGVVLFCMLYGFHPYSEPVEDDPGYLLIECGFSDQYVSSIDDIEISNAAQDLLCGLLAPESSRLCLEEVLVHDWINSNF